MTSKEIIGLIESENIGTFKKFENIPMGRSIHFSYASSKEEINDKMIKTFGRGFDTFIDNDAVFFVTNGTTLKKLNI